MTDKTNFTSEEWMSLTTAPVAASMLITMASPALGDAMKESMVVAKALGDKEAKANATGLLGAVLGHFTDMNSVKAAQPKLTAKDPAGAKAELLTALTNVAALVDAKSTPEEAQQFKGWLYKIANDTAEAAKEGDFMGIGGEKVNQAERDALKDIAGVLGVTA
jgi:hypothetical protein